MTTQEPPSEPHAVVVGRPAPVEPLAVPTRGIVGAGIGLWAVALVVTVVLPALHDGERSWWPWTCVAGILLGAFAWWYVGRGAARAAGA